MVKISLSDTSKEAAEQALKHFNDAGIASIFAEEDSGVYTLWADEDEWLAWIEAGTPSTPDNDGVKFVNHRDGEEPCQ